ncbi:hypothetical protein [Streptomyces sp. NPDC048277]|uniref:hypothetical protein n=1 Tax=Streptomyces sp. NPDC048277 TaxID=3155027 RepID=UPI0033C9F0FB
MTLLAGCGTAPASSAESTSTGTSTTEVADPVAKAHDIEQNLKAAVQAGGLPLLDEPTTTVMSLHDNGRGGEG